MELFNTLTGTIEPLRPRDEGHVGIYVCGPTVQAGPHFGHARANIVPDVLRRYLEWTGLQVTLVRNITDIDDKIIAAAQAEGRSAAAHAELFAMIWQDQVAQLGVRHPDIVPRATGHIPEILDLIQKLIERGAAYAAGGDVFFAVRSFAEYGKLSGRRPDELRAGARIAPDERKRDPLDFVLWKGAKPGEPSWDSPWGPGRPGWHIECSAMATRYLGADFDIHMGGTDLQFPHHENEIAQWEAGTGTPFARMWVHNGMLTLDQTKMSKSIGNIISLIDAIDAYGPGALRMYYLRAHYRRPIDFSEARLEEARSAFERITAFVRAASASAGVRAGSSATATPPSSGSGDGDPAAASGSADHAGADGAADGSLDDAVAAFRAAMDDDLSTPRAVAGIFDLVADGNLALEAGDASRAAAIREVVSDLAGVLGFDLTESAASDRELVDGLIGELVAVREQAREARDFATSDRIRERLDKLGVELADSRDGTRWHVARR